MQTRVSYGRRHCVAVVWWECHWMRGRKTVSQSQSPIQLQPAKVTWHQCTCMCVYVLYIILLSAIKGIHVVLVGSYLLCILFVPLHPELFHCSWQTHQPGSYPCLLPTACPECGGGGQKFVWECATARIMKYGILIHNYYIHVQYTDRWQKVQLL